MKLLRIILNGEEYPHYTQTKEFEKKFDFVENVWWQQHDINSLNQYLIHKCYERDYDVVYMQVQADNIIHPQTIKVLAQKSIIFNWTGDVRENLTAYTRLAENVVTLFTNTTDVNTLRNLGFKSDYLQTGYDHFYYYPSENKKNDNVVFCGTNYTNFNFPLTKFRFELVQRLHQTFLNKFNVYGGNWSSILPTSIVNNDQEAEIYRTCGVAISCSHFNYGRYFSDRLLREMACGAFVLSHKYQDYEMDFINGKHFVVFDDLDDLVEKCKYYLTHTEEAQRIGREASNYVSQNFRWGNFVDNFIELIKKYKK